MSSCKWAALPVFDFRGRLDRRSVIGRDLHRGLECRERLAVFVEAGQRHAFEHQDPDLLRRCAPRGASQIQRLLKMLRAKGRGNRTNGILFARRVREKQGTECRESGKS